MTTKLLLLLLYFATLALACQRPNQAAAPEDPARILEENRAKAQAIASNCDPSDPRCRQLQTTLLGANTMAPGNVAPKEFSLVPAPTEQP